MYIGTFRLSSRTPEQFNVMSRTINNILNVSNVIFTVINNFITKQNLYMILNLFIMSSRFYRLCICLQSITYRFLKLHIFKNFNILCA